MKFKEVEHRQDIALTPKTTKKCIEGTFEEFVDFLKNKVNEEELEMYFMQRKDLTYAYFEEEETIYYYEEEEEEKDKEDEPLAHRRKTKVKTSHLFGKLMLIMLVVMSTIAEAPANAAGFFRGVMKEDATNYTGLSGAKFTTPTGTVKIPGFLNIVESEEYTDQAFSLEDPNRIKQQPTVSMNPLPDGADESLLVAILSYREKFSLKDIQDTTGINVTKRQLDEATQLAIWIHASKFQIQFQIDPNSINDTAVRSLSTEITTWATQQVSSLTDGMAMGDYLFPDYKPALNAGNAKMTKTDEYVEYGPYTVTGQKGAKLRYGVLGGVLVDASKKELKFVTAEQQFYARFPVTYTGDKSIRMIGSQNKYSLNYGSGRVWLDKAPSENELKFSVGGSTGTNGVIQINAIDSVTKKPIPGVSAEISTTSPLTTITTDENGVADFTTAVGKYKLEFTVPSGYMVPDDQVIQLGFAGDIQVVNLNLAWSKAVVNFYAVDAKTLNPAGNSEAFIYDDTGKAVKRIGLEKGKVEGVVLSEGDYTIVQYKTDGGYAINTGTQFTASAGKITDVSVLQDPGAHPTTMTIDGASENDSWVYTISTESKVLFKMNGRNSLTVPLPEGRYSVIAHKSDGTSSTAPLTFTTTLNGKTDVTLQQEVGEESVTFSIVDTVKKKGIPNAVIGLFDEDANLITQKTSDENGVVTFDNVMAYSIYQVNVLAAPESVSGYFANGNRFLGQTRSFELELYSLKEVQEVTKVDTIYRVPNVTYTGPTYEYPA